jgi:hypothetical protein
MTGSNFPLLKKGGKFYLVYGDGLTATFTVTEILRYQALTSTSPTSDFVDLKSGAKLSASKLFSKAYNHPGYVIFQTCIAANGNPAWGRMFVIAKPYVE